MDSLCALCDCDLPANPVTEGERLFCCGGCHAVFNILSTQGALEGFERHPVFQQALRSGLISNPLLIEQIRSQRVEVEEEEREKLHLEIGEMWCPSCAEVIRLMLLREKGVLNCIVDYSTDLAAVEFAPRYVSRDKILGIIAGLGYAPCRLDEGRLRAVSRDLALRFGVAGFFSVNIMMFSYPIYAGYFSADPGGLSGLFAWLSFFAALPVLFYSGWPIFRRFWTSLSVGFLGMEALVAIGVTTSFGLSFYELFSGGIHVYFDSMTMIITLVLLGKIIEGRAKFSAKDSLLRLNRSVPRRGRKRFEDGSERFVLAKEVSLGDTLIALAGEKIVLDGELIEGEGTCDESLMTGEALPVHKGVGSMVLGGTVVQQGRLVYRVTATEKETALHQIIEMIERDIGYKSAYVRVTDLLVRWFVPAVAALACVVGLYSGSFSRMISVLLISCPCAIGIAAPLAEALLAKRLAEIGVIVRNRGCLSLLGRETLFVFDKTGTITEGRFSVLSGLSDLSDEIKSILKGLASQSIHPVAKAIASAISNAPAPFTQIEEVVGRGLRGSYQGRHYLLGSAALLHMQGITDPVPHANTTAYFVEGNQILATITLGDTIRPSAPEMIRALKPTPTLLLSGDNFEAVAIVAKKCGFDQWKGEKTPLEKRNIIQQLREEGNIVAMLGDGINDAPALTTADIGISVVSATDMSIQVSDLLLTTDTLSVIPKIGHLARKGHKIIRQNLFWAFFYNTIGIGLAAYGVLSPLFATGAMIASSVMVLLNAKRL